MKKYRQLLLLIIAASCFCLLLIYRHEYNRLHYVLEMFNFFGNPCNYSNLLNSDVVISQPDWGPLPIWQECEEKSYLYSAFWVQDSAKALAYAESGAEADRCYLWYEKDTQPVYGSFSYSFYHKNEHAYVYSCRYNNKNEKDTPYAVSFARKLRTTAHSKKIALAHVRPREISFNMTLCVIPSENYNKRSVLEFLSYHKMIGVDSFIFYEEILPYKLKKLLLNLSHKLGYNIAFLPWNFPKKNDVKRTIIQEDCKMRSLNKSKNVLTLDLFEYVVPTKHYFLYDLLNDFSGNLDELSLPVEEFCLLENYKNRPMVMQNLDMLRSSKNEVYKVYRHSTEGSIVNTQKLDDGMASVHRYIECQDDESPVIEDRTILKYSTDLLRTTLVQLFIHDQI